MAITRKQMSIVHVAKAALALDDDSYRAVLWNVAGVGSSRDLTSESFDALMWHFQQLGFKSTWNKANFTYRGGMASPRQVALIRKLWLQFTVGLGTDASLGKWLEHKFQVSSVRFLPSEVAHRAVGALKIMTARKGAPAAA